MVCSNVNTHSSKCVILLECVHDQPMSRVLTDSLTPALAMYEKNINFKTNLLVFENTLPNLSVKIWDYHPRQMCWRTSRIVMVLIRNDLLDCLPTPFSGKSSCEIPFAIMLVFQKIRVMHSHLISRLPGAYKMNYAISHNYTTHANISCIYFT